MRSRDRQDLVSTLGRHRTSVVTPTPPVAPGLTRKTYKGNCVFPVSRKEFRDG